ncbi:hypothetical protein ACOT7R_16340 [Clostridium perfringens]|uniref:hypothetical protein n=1 Tax=Clostridium perfringens TaxID=1502 RepID=UPI001F06E8EB|nr:hypothetical protein [Clostridium perfringens]MCH1964305.1 hypothetical protein [Clostridium perfringens]
MRREFRVLDTESVKEFASGLENQIFDLVTIIDSNYLEKYKDVNENCLGYYILNTCDGRLIFSPDEVEEVIK